MTRKYHVASFAMLSKIVGTWNPDGTDALVFLVQKMINANARKSYVYT